MKIKNIMANVLCATLIISNLTVTSASNVIISETSLEDENIKSEEYVVDTNISEDKILHLVQVHMVYIYFYILLNNSFPARTLL